MNEGLKLETRHLLTSDCTTKLLHDKVLGPATSPESEQRSFGLI
jgi:hypothetical protein